MNKLLKLTTALLLSTFVLSSFATELNYNIYQLSVTTQEQVKNDIMKVTLMASHQAQSSTTVSQVVNKQMTVALELLESTTGIDYETANYQTHPAYRNQQISGWRASQQLILKSSDVKQLSKLIGQLQQDLKLSAMSFEVSKPVRQQVQNKLSVTALNQFKERATLIVQTMGADDYRIINVNVNTGMQFVPVARAMVRTEMSMMADSMSAPAVKSGNSVVNVNVAGKIQLIFN
jgi:predicted secreted protein